METLVQKLRALAGLLAIAAKNPSKIAESAVEHDV
jgi:hypothetical protein